MLLLSISYLASQKFPGQARGLPWPVQIVLFEQPALLTGSSLHTSSSSLVQSSQHKSLHRFLSTVDMRIQQRTMLPAFLSGQQELLLCQLLTLLLTLRLLSSLRLQTTLMGSCIQKAYKVCCIWL